MNNEELRANKQTTCHSVKQLIDQANRDYLKQEEFSGGLCRCWTFRLAEPARPGLMLSFYTSLSVLYLPAVLFPRYAHGLPEVPVFVYIYRSGRYSALPQLPSHPQPPAIDAVSRGYHLPRLRLGGVPDSALLARGWMAAPDALYGWRHNLYGWLLSRATVFFTTVLQ